MKLTAKKYEQAKKDVAKGKEAEIILRDWQDALKKIGHNGNGRVTVINIEDDGTLSWECELEKKTEAPKADEDKSPFDRSGKK